MQVSLTLDQLREMRTAGGGHLILELENPETGEITEARIDLTLEQIDKLIKLCEANERAMNN